MDETSFSSDLLDQYENVCNLLKEMEKKHALISSDLDASLLEITKLKSSYGSQISQLRVQLFAKNKDADEVSFLYIFRQ